MFALAPILVLVQHFDVAVFLLLWHLARYPNGKNDAVEVAQNLWKLPDQSKLEDISR